MVRFIIKTKKRTTKRNKKVYIPIWLDLLFYQYCLLFLYQLSLHSNMVRFIIHFRQRVINIITLVYIPIWLDLLFNHTDIKIKN